jgi:hypothetical protein
LGVCFVGSSDFGTRDVGSNEDSSERKD